MPRWRTCGPPATFGATKVRRPSLRLAENTLRSCIFLRPKTSNGAIQHRGAQYHRDHHDNRILARVVFDTDDIDAAFAELDARYIAGEAASYRETWSVIAAGLRRAQPVRGPAVGTGLREHRSPVTGGAFEAADSGRKPPRWWDLTRDSRAYVEVVHRLSGLGAVVTHAARGTRKTA